MKSPVRNKIIVLIFLFVFSVVTLYHSVDQMHANEMETTVDQNLTHANEMETTVDQNLMHANETETAVDQHLMHANEMETAVDQHIEHPRFSHLEYSASSVEDYVMNNLVKLGFDKDDNPMTCGIWTNPNATTAEIHKKINDYKKDIEAHTKAITEFKPIPDLMKSIRAGEDINEVCKKTRPHPDGLRALFPSNELSLSTDSGYVEPLLPPLRHHDMCYNGRNKFNIMKMDYLVHDFEVMCHKLKPHSKLVLFDFGASLDFHNKIGLQPMVILMDLYEKFGFHFDHIYAFEMRPKNPKKIYEEQLPEKHFHSYHWINVGVTSEEGHRLNPFHSILKKFNEDDLIIVKLDIDTSSIEVPLAYQLLKDKDGIYSKLIDQFYFEHHVHLGELKYNWAKSMNGTVKESFELFQNLRKKGIATHPWP